MPPAVSPATPDEVTAACRALYAHLRGPDRDARALRCRDMLRSGEIDPTGLFVARGDGGAVRGAMLVQPLPGALGLAWPPRAEPGRDQTATEAALAAAACGWLRSRGVKVCQSFAPETERPDMAPLERAGFRRVTSVVHLRREIDPGRDPFDPRASPLTIEPFAPEAEAEFTAALLATHDGSLDCPELTGTRTPAELLDAFRGSLTMKPPWWFLVRRTGEPVGVVLFEAGTEPGVLELSYLGLAPAARGRGWAGWLVRFAAGLAARDGNRALTLSVDARNGPALRLYHGHGFREYDRRDVYLAAWEGPPPG
jgi:mycothiol synthase